MTNLNKVLSENELNMIRGKLLVGHASLDEIREFLNYVNAIEMLVIEASNQDFYGTEGYEHRLGWD